MDLCPIPLKWGIIAELHKDDFMQRLENEKAIDKSITNIILIKTNVYDCLYRELKDKTIYGSGQNVSPFLHQDNKKICRHNEKALKQSNIFPIKG